MSTKKRHYTVTEREGINYLRAIIEEENCIFHKIHKENDSGNNGIIELVQDAEVKGVCIAIQVKSGLAYCDSTSYTILADKAHLEYWKRHSLPVVGVVYDPRESKAYWINI